MNIKFSNEIYNGTYLADKYSKYANKENLIEGVPYINFPFSIENANDYKYLSWILIDHDANPVVNFSWIHWLVGNYEITNSYEHIPELLVNSNKQFNKGHNSFSCPLTNIKDENVYLNYGGPTPPDCDHTYTLEVWGHNKKLNISDGFYYNQLITELEKIDSVHITSKLRARC